MVLNFVRSRNFLKIVKNKRGFCENAVNLERPLILGIETSCDDTGAAVLNRNGIVLGESLFSQQNTHLSHGGIIPPIAQELHRQNIEKTVSEAVAGAGIKFEDLDAIAVTNRPGLTLSLIVGLRYAKHLCRKHKKPLIPIHHMEAHALTARITHKFNYPFLCLLASGGHSILTVVKQFDEFYRLGETLDDAPGEAFDKISRRLKLRNLPMFENKCGGAAIELAAKDATDPDQFEFPLPLARQRNCQFSFAGLKNNATRFIKHIERDLKLSPDEVMPNYANFCAGFLKATTRHICHRVQRAIEFCELNNMFGGEAERTLVFSGGVACNNFIYTALVQLGEEYGYKVVRPPPKHCTDNGAMIAWNGIERFCNGSNVFNEVDFINIDVYGKCFLGHDYIERVASSELRCKWKRLPILQSAKPSGDISLEQ